VRFIRNGEQPTRPSAQLPEMSGRPGGFRRRTDPWLWVALTEATIFLGVIAYFAWRVVHAIGG
jgi:hypothetical protein